MLPVRDNLADALADAARAINAPSTMEETLDAIVTSARASVPGFAHVGISLVNRNGTIETLAGTGQLVWELVAPQYSLEEGPCVSAMRSEPVVVAEHFDTISAGTGSSRGRSRQGSRHKWRCSSMSRTKPSGAQPDSTERDTIDLNALHAAELFATHAALALGRARRESQLNEAIGGRTVLGKAIGLVIESYQINDERAFQFIVRASSTSNLKARDVAVEIVDRANQDYTV